MYDSQQRPLPTGLAPMEGVTNFAARLWMWWLGQPDFLCTPFLRVTHCFPHKELPQAFAPEIRELRSLCPYPLLPQLMAGDPKHFVRVVQSCFTPDEIVEINFGCPAPLAVGRGAGSSVLRSSSEFSKVLHLVACELDESRIAIKMRTGFEDDSQFPALIAALAAFSFAKVTVHGRTRQQGYGGCANWQRIAEAATCLASPVFASGDIVNKCSLAARRAMIEETGIRGVIIGRGALRNPWIFAELRGKQAEVSRSQLAPMLSTLYWLQHLYAESAGKLITFIGDEDIFHAPQSLEEWAYRSRKLSELCHDDYRRFALGRVKLHWNYLRTSLPEEFFAPAIFRAKSLAEFLDVLEQIPVKRSTLRPAHRRDHDSLFGRGGSSQTIQ